MLNGFLRCVCILCMPDLRVFSSFAENYDLTRSLLLGESLHALFAGR